ncbi:MAG: hypothetical protein RLZZ293_1263, partial [Pseudomonadota bacterium]
MSNNNLQWFKFRLIRIIGLCVAFGIAIVIAVCYWIITTNRQQRIQEFKNQVTITNDLLQSGLSAQITMIANNPEFANYLFANSIDRQKHKSDVFLLLKHLDADFIQGIEVIRHNPYSLNKQVVYAQGIKTLYYTNLEMCYLNNNKLSRLVGDCVMRHFTLILYFDPSLYLAKLHQLNHDIHLSSSNKDLSFRFNPIAQTHFAELKIESSSSLSIPIHISWDNELEKLILLIILVVLAICIIFYVISYKIVSNLIVHKITQPLRNMINAVNDNQHLPVSSENLSELNQLIEVVNLYQDTQLKLKLSETYKRVIHDIRSPLFAINVSLNDVLDSNHPSRKTINDAIQNTLTILDNALIATNNIAPQFNIIDSHKVYISIYDLLKQIVDLKIIEWTKYQNQVNLTLKFDDLDNYWILINPIEFKRHLSNLLNNAFQARRLEQINISLEVTEKNEVITLKIKDNG